MMDGYELQLRATLQDPVECWVVAAGSLRREIYGVPKDWLFMCRSSIKIMWEPCARGSSFTSALKTGNIESKGM